jgi:uncharacterized protein (TIGR03663 family)
MNKKQAIFLVLLVVFFGLLFCHKMGEPSLFEEDEARITEVAREILVTGKWIDVQHNFEPWFHKPPLYPWLTAVAFMVFGISEFTARIWAALFSLGAIVSTFFIAKLIYGKTVAGLSSMILGSSLLVTVLGRAGFVDSGLMFFTAASMLFFLIAYRNESRKSLLLLSALSAALGTLTKGPLGIILPGASIFLYLLVRKDLGFFSRYLREFILSIAVYAAVATPWWIAETVIHGGAFLSGLLGQYMIGIYSTTFQKHSGPFYFYIIVLLVGMIPWSVHTIYGLFRAIKKEERDQSLLFLIWTAVVFVIFSTAQTKVPGYILPIFPPLSIITAKSLKGILFEGSRKVKLLTFGGLVALILLLFLAAALSTVPAEQLQYLVMLRWLFLSFLILSVVSLTIVNIRKVAPLAIIPLLLVSVVFVIMASEVILPAFEVYHPARLLVADVRKIVPENDEIEYYNYKTWFRSSLVFYTKSKITMVDEKDKIISLLRGKDKIVVYTDENLYGMIKGDLPGNTRTIAKQGDLVALTNVAEL